MATVRPDGLRWRREDADEEGRLFSGFAPERHLGIGEYRGLEFLHVEAASLLNRVPAASRMPFRWTINAYRGCSHACVYCLSGDTLITLGDGQRKPLAEVRVGDRVIGTSRENGARRYVTTTVLDQWQSVRPAVRVTLADRTVLVGSADHRLLTDHGWKHLAGSNEGAHRRPHLTRRDRLAGAGKRADEAILLGGAVRATPELEVAQVEELEGVLPLFDLTTSSGDFIANGVVSHNCFARPTHTYLGLGMGEDFDRKIVVKVNAVERVRAELSSSRWRGEAIAMGTNTDPYQRAEGRYHLTQGIIGELAAARNPFSILTKSTLILRDLDLLVAASRRCDVRLAFSIGTLDRNVWRLTEPGTPAPERRVEAVRRLNAAGIPTGVLVAPVIPGLSDSHDQVQEVVEACRGAGAPSVTVLALHLRPGVKAHYLDWLARARPDLIELHEQRFGGRANQSQQQRTRLARLADHGASGGTPAPVPHRQRASADGPEPEVTQLGLF